MYTEHVNFVMYSCLLTEFDYKQAVAYLLQAQSLLLLPESIADRRPTLAAPLRQAQAG